MVNFKTNICITKILLLVITAAILCVLSGCAQSATRHELIQWFQKTYTDAPIVVASNPVIDGNDKIYEAYLEDYPDLKFYIKSDYSYVMEHSVFHNKTNFCAVYGSYYFSEYQKEHPVQFAEYNFDEDAVTFSLDIYYADRTELVKAFDELRDIQAYMNMQEYPVKAWHHIYFESPLCDHERLTYTLGSGVVDLTDTNDDEEVLYKKQKDFESELAIWVSFFHLHTDWFTEEELEQAFTYLKNEEYDNPAWSIYIGELAIYTETGQAAYYPRIAAPTSFAISFWQLYQILSDIGWENLKGNEEEFSFVGIDNVLYEFSYELRNIENQGRNYRMCTWLADKVPYVGFGAAEGYITSDYTFYKMTGLKIKTAGNE